MTHLFLGVAKKPYSLTLPSAARVPSLSSHIAIRKILRSGAPRAACTHQPTAKADLDARPTSVNGAKRTWRGLVSMSATDPKRTSAANWHREIVQRSLRQIHCSIAMLTAIGCDIWFALFLPPCYVWGERCTANLSPWPQSQLHPKPQGRGDSTYHPNLYRPLRARSSCRLRSISSAMRTSRPWNSPVARS